MYSDIINNHHITVLRLDASSAAAAAVTDLHWRHFCIMATGSESTRRACQPVNHDVTANELLAFCDAIRWVNASLHSLHYGTPTAWNKSLQQVVIPPLLSGQTVNCDHRRATTRPECIYASFSSADIGLLVRTSRQCCSFNSTNKNSITIVQCLSRRCAFLLSFLRYRLRVKRVLSTCIVQCSHERSAAAATRVLHLSTKQLVISINRQHTSASRLPRQHCQ